jgi:hypothetical protein
MAYTHTDLDSAFDSEAGDVASIATSSQKQLWFNEGQARLLRFKPSTDDVVWVTGDRSLALPADFIQLDRVVYDESVRHQGWVVFGGDLVIHEPDGATADGSARLYYHADWPKISDTVASALSSIGDIACLYYALHRFYRLLASNRAYYKRYATLQGANAVTVGELQGEADRYYQDFIDTRADLEPLPASSFYGG